jgi:hypothetical protein
VIALISSGASCMVDSTTGTPLGGVGSSENLPQKAPGLKDGPTRQGG